MEKLLHCIVDNNKRVQDAACSAFSSLEEEAREELVPYLEPILDTLSQAFEKFQRRNRLLLYDTIGTLAEVVSEALGSHEQSSRLFIELIMPPLMNDWENTHDNNTDLFPLLEVRSSFNSWMDKID